MKPPSPDRHAWTRWAPVVGILALLCLISRGLGLMALPLFGDEAIYLRWAQLIRGDGSSPHHWWVSLVDPKPPLHYWLIALVSPLGTDPLTGARLISVLSGLLSIPLLVWVGSELGRFFEISNDFSTKNRFLGAEIGIFAAILMIFSPFFAFYQRLATADALFVAQSLAIVALSLRWARTAAWSTALALGAAIGLALLTRQGLSYTLCAMPIACLLLHTFKTFKSAPRPRLLTPILQLLTLALLAGALWTPYLLAELRPRTLARQEPAAQGQPLPDITSADLLAEVKRRILYQEKFTDAPDRAQLIIRNLKNTFIPTFNERGTWRSGWLPLYLTPVLFTLSLLGLLLLALRRHWGILFLLALWLLLLLGPVILLGNVVYSRYVLAGAVPLLLAAAYAVVDLMTLLFASPLGQRRPALAWLATAALLVITLAQPLRELGRQSSRWWTQTLTAQDEYQYLYGWTSGMPATKAIRTLTGLANEGPLVLITDNGWGTPADAVWTYLSPHKNISLFYTDHPDDTHPDLLTPGNTPGTISLRRDKWLFPPYTDEKLPSGIPILYITHCELGKEADLEARLKKAEPAIERIETFYGIKGSEDCVILFQIRTGPAPTASNITHEITPDRQPPADLRF